MTADVLTVSSKGQVVIPAEMRRSLGIGPSTRLAAWGFGDSIVLKVLHLPGEEDFRETLEEAREWAARSGLDKEDVADAIASVRSKDGR